VNNFQAGYSNKKYSRRTAMEQTKKIPDPESFAKNIENTIDKLFIASRQIEIDPLTSEVREISQDETDQGPSFDGKILDLGSELELEEKETEAVNLEQQFSRLNQLLLTLEWEVTQTHVVSAKDLVETIQKNPEIEADKNLHELLDLMAMILEGMADHPERMPTSGPEALQKGLDILKNIVWNKEQDSKAREELLRSAKKELESAIDTEVTEIAYEDAQKAALKEKSSEQQEQPADFALKASMQEKVTPIEPELPERSVLVDAIKSHIKILDDCIGYISPVEKLLARTPGIEKLHHFQKNIKGRLEKQKKILERALTGDYGPSVEEIPSGDISCPWHELVVAQWDQEQVAFAPEDVAFAGAVPWWTKKGLKKLETFKLKKLKTWPWTKLQSLMHGELSNQEESQLIKLEFPVLQKSNSSLSYSQPSDNPILLVLSRADKGLVLMLDTSLETFSITSECSWEPSAKNNGPWVGHLKLENKQISVATLESLLNTLTNE
jgi:hypothetical protein